jgi:hypothetical protein
LGEDLHEFWCGREVPVGACRLDVAEIGGEQVHLHVNVNAIPIPADESVDREGVTEVMIVPISAQS